MNEAERQVYLDELEDERGKLEELNSERAELMATQAQHKEALDGVNAELHENALAIARSEAIIEMVEKLLERWNQENQ